MFYFKFATRADFKLEQQLTLRRQSKSTLDNYIRRIASFVIHFGKLPEQIDPEEINEYLAALARDPKSPSRSSFKHMVYGLLDFAQAGLFVYVSYASQFASPGICPSSEGVNTTSMFKPVSLM